MQRKSIFLLTILACLFLQASAYASPEVIRDKTSGKLLYVMPDQAERAEVQADRTLESDVALETHKAVLGLSAPTVDLIPGQPEVDDLGYTHITYKQNYKGIPVYRATLISHLDPAGRVHAINARVAENLSLKTKPLVSAKQALKIAASLWASELSTSRPELQPAELVIFDEALLKNTPDGKAYLAWKIQALHHATRTDRTFVIDAKTGKLLQSESSERHQALNQRIYDCSIINQSGNWGCPSEQYNAQYNYTFGRRLNAPTRGPNPIPQFNPSREVDVAYEYLSPAAYNYYLQTFGRYGANNVGGMGDGTYMPIGRTSIFVMVDNVWPDIPNDGLSGCPDAARWTGAWGEIALCAGTAEQNPSQSQMGTIKWEVFFHEYAHAVMFTEFGNTNYSGQPGTLEESLSDAMGLFNMFYATNATTPEQRVWRMGKDLWWERNLADPGSNVDPTYGPDPDKLHSPSFYCGEFDNGGVHLNATVLGKAAYLMTEGGQFNGCAIEGIGVAHAQQLFYDFITNHMTPTITFNGAFAGIIQACNTRYGVESFDCQQVTKALQAVELDQVSPCIGGVEVPPACAVPQIVPGVVDAARPTQALVDLFSPSEHVYSLGAGWQGVTEVDVYLTPASASRVDGADIEPIIGEPIRVSLNENGDFVTPLWTADQVGFFDIVVDANLDGVFNSSTDRNTSFEVRALTDGDGLCYVGESYDTTENCRTARIDCACQPLNGAPRYCTSFANQGRFRCLTLSQIQWFKAHPIQEATEVTWLRP